jgi:tetratricopeptide (TPR) repeat protein
VRPKTPALSWSFLVARWLIPLDPDEVADSDSGPLLSQALFLKDQQRFNDALVLVDKILAQKKNLSRFREAAYVLKADIYFRLRDWAETIISCDELLKTKPNCIEALDLKGASYGKLECFDQAISCFTLAVQTQPTDTYAAFNMGGTYLLQGKLVEALSWFDRASELSSDFTDAWYNKGLVLCKLKRYEEARTAWQKAASLGDEVAKSQLGSLEDNISGSHRR